MRAARERNWEFIGHGFSQKNMQKVADERDDIARTAEAIRRRPARTPRGWLGPGLTETWETPDLLAEAGYDYVCDWVLDDQPVVAENPRQADRQRPLHAGMQRRRDDADPASQGAEYHDRAIDQFEQLYSDARRSARVMALVAAPLHHGRAAPAQIFPPALEHIREQDDVAVLDRRADPGLVCECRAEGAVRRTNTLVSSVISTAPTHDPSS